MPAKVVLIAHDIRSCHNVGSLLRTADGLGVSKLYMTGFTPYPHLPNDTRLPHIYKKITNQIKKTSLGAEASVSWDHARDIKKIIATLRSKGYAIVALEQSPESIDLATHKSKVKTALIVGNEVSGLPSSVLKLSDIVVEIPMRGAKESLNVASAAAIALHHFTALTRQDIG